MRRYLRDPIFSRFDTIPECDRHRRSLPGNYTWWAVQYGRFLPRDAMLSAVHAVVVYLSVRLSVWVCLSHFGIV